MLWPTLTGYGLNDYYSIPGKGIIFLRQFCNPPGLYTIYSGGSFPGKRRPESEADSSVPKNTKHILCLIKH